jgi:hypothetical protein
MRRTPRPGGFARQPQVRELIDFSQPVALLLLGVLYFITDDEGPGQLIGAYRDSLPPGSYLALSHGCADEVPTEVIAGTAAAYDQATAPLVLPAVVASGRPAPGSAGGVEDRHVRRGRTQGGGGPP